MTINSTSGGGIARWTEIFPFVCSAAAGSTNYYGPEHGSYNQSWLSEKSLDTSWTATPAAQPYSLLPMAPVSCKVIRAELWIRFNDVAGPMVENMYLYKIPYTTAAVPGTPVLIETFALDTTGLANTNSYDYSVDITTGNSLDAGDCLVLLRKNTSSPKSYLGRCALFLEQI